MEDAGFSEFIPSVRLDAALSFGCKRRNEVYWNAVCVLCASLWKIRLDWLLFLPLIGHREASILLPKAFCSLELMKFPVRFLGVSRSLCHRREKQSFRLCDRWCLRFFYGTVRWRRRMRWGKSGLGLGGSTVRKKPESLICRLWNIYVTWLVWTRSQR